MAKSSKSRASKSTRQGGDGPAPSKDGAEPRAIDKARAANKRPPVTTKPLKGAAARRKVEQQRRRRTLLYTGAAVAVLAVLVAVIVVDRQEDSATDEDFQAAQAALAPEREAAGCTDVQQHPEASRTHINASEQPTDWNSNPPASGMHLAPPQWVRPGYYEEEQDERAVVHSLEHGYVAVQYKGISDDQVEQLVELQSQHDGEKLVVQPYDGLEADGVALSAWTFTQTCEQVNLDVIDGFIDGFMMPRGSQSVAPEPLAG